MNKVSIVTICLNAEETIERAIESVLGQTYNNIEYIIVDGESKDRTPEIIERFKSRIDTLIREPDDGLYHAMNKGIAVSTGDVIYFLNADDVLYDRNVVNDFMDAFNSNQNVDLIYGDIVWLKDGAETYYPQNYTITRESLARRTIVHQSIFARKSLFLDVGLFNQDNRVVSDYDWILRVFLSSNHQYRYLSRPVALFSLHGRSVNEVWERERRVVMKNYFSTSEILRHRIIPLLVENQKKRLRNTIRNIKTRSKSFVKRLNDSRGK